MTRAPPGAVRIIGGRWRGRRLAVPVRPDLRPTPDRVRETLFNWLSGVIEGARCLDLFAGSGALGFESVSRGAAGAVLVERDAMLCRGLREGADVLGAAHVAIVHAEAMQWLAQGADAPFDIVFLDPPFAAGLLEPVAHALEAHGWLKAMAWIYVEGPAHGDAPSLPANWTPWRDGRAGAVGYHLFRRGH